MDNGKLTTKQERFVQALVSGMSQREAYRSAYNCERVKPESIDSLACRLFANVKVRSRYDSLIAELASRVLWDREKAAKETLAVRDIALRHIAHSEDTVTSEDGFQVRLMRDIPRESAKFVSDSTSELNKMFGIYDKPADGDGQVVIVDDI